MLACRVPESHRSRCTPITASSLPDAYQENAATAGCTAARAAPSSVGKVGSDEASIERATDLLGHASKEITKRHYRRKPELIKPVR